MKDGSEIINFHKSNHSQDWIDFGRSIPFENLVDAELKELGDFFRVFARECDEILESRSKKQEEQG